MSVIIQRNRILIEGIKEESFQDFIKNFSVFDFSENLSMEIKWTSAKKVEYQGKDFFAIPRNTPPNFFMKFIEEDKKDLIRDESFIKPRKIIIEMKKEFSARNDLQRSIIDFLSGEGSYSEIVDKPRRALFADTGEGKTFLTINDISKVGLATVILCPDNRAVKTWREEITKFTNVEDKEIITICGSDTLENLAYSKNIGKIYLLSLKTITSVVDNGRDNLIVDFFVNNGIGYKVSDETHMMLKAFFNVEMLIQTKKTTYLTATDSRRLYKENFILQYLIPSANLIFRQEKVKKFEYIQVDFYSHASKSEQKGVKSFAGFNASKYISMIIENPNLKEEFLNKFLLPTFDNALKKRSSDKFKIAILFKTRESGSIFGEIIASMYPNLSVGYYNGSIKEDEKQREICKDIIISTDRSFAGVINISGLEIIINTIPSRTESNILQIMGRLRHEKDKKRIFYQYIDLSVPCLRNISNSMKKIISEVALSMKRVTLNKKEVFVDEKED